MGQGQSLGSFAKADWWKFKCHGDLGVNRVRQKLNGGFENVSDAYMEY